MYARKLLLLSAALLLASGGLAAAPPATFCSSRSGLRHPRGPPCLAGGQWLAFWRTDVWAVPLAEASQRWVAMARLRIGSRERA